MSKWIGILVALAMFAIGWHGLTRKSDAGRNCLDSPRANIAAASDGTPLVCESDGTWKQSH